MLELEADHRRHAEIENAIRDLKYGVGLNHMPPGCFAANAAWLAAQAMAHNLARWTARIGLGEQIMTTKTLRRRVFALADGSPARHTASPCICHSAGLGIPSSVGLGPVASHSTPGLTAPVRQCPNAPPTERPRKLAPVRSASASCRVLSRHLARHSHCRPPSAPPRLQTAANPSSSRIRARTIASLTSSPPFQCPHAVHRWIRVYAVCICRFASVACAG